MVINAGSLTFQQLNDAIRKSQDQDIYIKNALGQRFIAAGLGGRNLTIDGVPGNALGAYLNGCNITVNGNAQDAVGDTMNDGEIVVHGNIGDAAGYAMRGGAMYIEGNAGYRAGIHMKAYREKQPVIVIGGRAGSFIGEYQAGGTIIVLGMNPKPASDAHGAQQEIVHNFACTGMHGGRMFLRGDTSMVRFPDQVTTKTASEQDVESIRPYLERFCFLFGHDLDTLLSSQYTLITPNSENPYKELYVAN